MRVNLPATAARRAALALPVYVVLIIKATSISLASARPCVCVRRSPWLCVRARLSTVSCAALQNFK